MTFDIKTPIVQNYEKQVKQDSGLKFQGGINL